MSIRIMNNTRVAKKTVNAVDEDEDDFILDYVYTIKLMRDEIIINQDGYFDYQFYFAYTYFPKADRVSATLVSAKVVDAETANLLGFECDDDQVVETYEVHVGYPHPDEQYDDIRDRYDD